MIHREHERRAYLQALGIDVWVPRDAEEPLEPVAESPVSSGLDWPELRDRVASCTRCELAQSRTNTVFGVGNEAADWMIIGEAPGAEEDRQGEPFVGRAGKLLDQMLFAIGESRESVFIANILKCSISIVRLNWCSRRLFSRSGGSPRRISWAVTSRWAVCVDVPMTSTAFRSL